MAIKTTRKKKPSKKAQLNQVAYETELIRTLTTAIITDGGAVLREMFDIDEKGAAAWAEATLGRVGERIKKAKTKEGNTNG